MNKKKPGGKKYYPSLSDIAFGDVIIQLYFPELDEEKEDKRINNGVERQLHGKNATMRFKSGS